MWKANLLAVLKLVLILLCTGWISLWLLKPTNLWTRKWKNTEDSTRSSVIGYYGLNFALYTFPIISLAIVGLVCLNLKARELPRSRQTRISTSGFSNPLVVNSLLGVLSSMEILAVFLFILFLAWTFYAHISNDFRKLIPVKSMKLGLWQLKFLRVATRFGLLAEACLALLLLPILRGLAVFQLLGIQFEVSVRYHIWLGTATILFASFHGASTLFIWGVSHHIQDEVWKWQRTGRIYLAGEISLLAGLVMWITSLPQVRRQKFEVFYHMHHLYIIVLVFFFFHAGDRHFYMVFPGIFLFGLDKLLRIIQSRTETCILSARLFPCKALELVLPKGAGLKYTPTSVIFMKIPSISKFEWHSFSISSSSSVDDSLMSVIIKCEGWWTNSLHDMIQAQVDLEAGKTNCIPVAIEGPYGPASMDFLRYDSILLVAGGIGITPFLSILQEIAAIPSSNRYRLPTRIQLLFVIKRSQDICLLNSISSLLQNNPSQKWHLKVKVFVTQERQPNATVGEILEELLPAQTIHFAQNGPIYAVHGPENYLWRAALVAIASIVFFVLLLCFNHIFIPSKKKGSPSEKLAVSSEKTPPEAQSPSWVADLLIISSFIIALACSSLVTIVLRWRRMRKEIPPASQKKGKAKEVSSDETKGLVEEHEVHFGGRPNLEDTFTAFANETGGPDIGVLVCGPETMKEAVAKLCRKNSSCFKIGPNKKKPFFSYHCLNFNL